MAPDWIFHAIALFGLLLVLFLTGVPIAFAFLSASAFYLAVVLGRPDQLFWVALSPYSSLSNFSLAPVFFFVLLGAILFDSGTVDIAIKAVEAWTPNIRARLSVITNLAGAVLASLTGSGMASATLMAKLMVPKMLQQGYSPMLAIGPSFSAGALALLIPPSGVTIILGTVAGISIGQLLIGGIIPALILAFVFSAFCVAVAYINPRLAPSEAAIPMGWGERWRLAAATAPFGLIIFSVIGLMILGVAGPSESAAFGAIAAFLVTAIYRRMSWTALRNAISETVRISIMLYTIIMGSAIFSQVIAYSGVTLGFSEAMVGAGFSPLATLLLMQGIILFLGMFLEVTTIILITMPLFMPVVHAMGIDPLQFGVVTLVNLELGTFTPPVGLVLFAAHAALPREISLGTVYKAAVPFFLLQLAVVLLLILSPGIVSWLPNMLRDY